MSSSLAGTVSVQEYRRSVYKPDCDYVDGVLEDRHGGETAIAGFR